MGFFQSQSKESPFHIMHVVKPQKYIYSHSCHAKPQEARKYLLETDHDSRQRRCCANTPKRHISYFEFFQSNQNVCNCCCQNAMQIENPAQENIKFHRTEEEMTELRYMSLVLHCVFIHAAPISAHTQSPFSLPPIVISLFTLPDANVSRLWRYCWG